MAEQTFRSPGFFEQEIDLSARQQSPVGTPSGIIGTAQRGPAFVPVTVGSFPDFRTKFGDLDPKKFGPYAVREFMKHRNAVTYLRVLGAGANDTVTDIETTRTEGTVKNAGFKLTSTTAPDDPQGRHANVVQFLVAKHFVSASEAVGFPVLTQNDSVGTSADNFTSLVRAMILVPSGTRVMVLNGTGEAFSAGADDQATVTSAGLFKLVISSSATGYATTDGLSGLRILSASLDPEHGSYIGKILNTDPERFIDEEHLLYADFAIENELATVATGESDTVAIVSGSTGTSTDSGDTTQVFRDMFGRFDTRYTAPKTTKFISQPFGETEFNLFHFEAIDDGVYANTKYKISITDLKKSTNPADPYGTFNVVVRKWSDLDTDQQILERFPNVSLNPRASNYIARAIGDKKVFYNFDADTEDERRLIVKGKYPNRSNIIRVVMDSGIEKGSVPEEALPFGFRGVEVLKTTDTLTDEPTSALAGEGASSARRLTFVNNSDLGGALSGSIVPPLPFRFKVTKGAVLTTGGWTGNPGVGELVDSRYHWGVKFERLPKTASFSNAIYNANAGSSANKLVEAYTKFLGIKKLDSLVTGSGADKFNNNKFTLSRVAFSNGAVTDLTASVREHAKEMAYIRNGSPDATNFKITDSSLSRITLGTLVSLTSSIEFNRFSEFAKFSTILAGGFDGVNILDKNAARLNDKAASSDTGGGASTSFTSPGLTSNVAGTGRTNNAVVSYQAATKLMTDPFVVNTNLLAIPGIRDSFVTDFAADRVRDYSMAMYVMDPVEYDEDTTRLFDEDTTKPDVRKTQEQFESRAIDNNYTATYFPDVIIDDPVNKQKVKVPPSVAALGALAFNDKSSYPWFAPAGFNRAALDFVSNVDVRLNASDRANLYDARINPIATFPRQGFVVWGQKTLQQAQSALDRVNVRRLMLEIKRLIVGIAQKFVFEQNTASTRERFRTQVAPVLALIQTQSGIERFSVVMDESNNTTEDIESNRLNGRIVVVPTRTIEFISIDFIITNSGVQFS